MKSFFISLLLMALGWIMYSQNAVFSIDTCRQMALDNDKTLKMAREQIEAARNEKRSSFANFLPSIDLSGTYLRNDRKLNLMSDAQLQGLNNSLGSLGKVVGELAAASDPALLPLLEPLGGLSENFASAFTYDIRNVWIGNASLTQPLYMGGRILAFYQLNCIAQTLAQSQYSTQEKTVMVRVDELYWQIISLFYKRKLAVGYRDMIENLSKNVQLTYQEGMTTMSDVLTVAVRVNESEISLQKVEDALHLTKMALAQLCGLNLEADYLLRDETTPIFKVDNSLWTVPQYEMNEVYSRRSEIRSLELVTDINKKKSIIERSYLLPEVAAAGNYLLSNPNLYNGLERRFKGILSFGITVTVPLWHWGKDYYHWKAAKSRVVRARINEINAKEMVELQVKNSEFQYRQAVKTIILATSNMNKAQENLQNASDAYSSGFIPLQNLLDAQTAWYAAQSEMIDAEISQRLCRLYLNKALGLPF